MLGRIPRHLEVHPLLLALPNNDLRPVRSWHLGGWQIGMLQTGGWRRSNAMLEDELKQLKAEMEAKTGKTYKIREPRQNINDLIVIGALQDAPTTMWEALKMGFVLALLFMLSFGVYYVLFFQYPPKNYKGKSELFQPKQSMQYQKPKIHQPLLQEEPLKPIDYEDEF